MRFEAVTGVMQRPGRTLLQLGKPAFSLAGMRIGSIVRVFYRSNVAGWEPGR